MKLKANKADDVGDGGDDDDDDDDDDGETFPRVVRQKWPLNPDFGLNSIVSFRRADIFRLLTAPLALVREGSRMVRSGIVDDARWGDGGDGSVKKKPGGHLRWAIGTPRPK